MASSRPREEDRGRVHLVADDYLPPQIDREKLVNSIQVHRLQIEALRQRIKCEKDDARRAGSRQQEDLAPPGRKRPDVSRCASSDRRAEWWMRSTESRINTVQEDDSASNPSTITLFDGPSDKFILDGSRLSVEELAPFLEDQKIFTDSNSDDAGQVEQKFSIVDRTEVTGSARKILSIRKARHPDLRESSRTVHSPGKATPSSHRPAMGENTNPNSSRMRSWLEAQLVPADRGVLQEAINACVDTRRVLIAWRVVAQNLRARTMLENHILRQRQSQLSCVILLRCLSYWRRCAGHAKLQRVKDGMWESALSRVIRRWNKSHKKVTFTRFCRGVLIERQRRIVVEKANALLKRRNRSGIADAWDAFVFACHHRNVHFSTNGRTPQGLRNSNLKLARMGGNISSSLQSQLENAAADHNHRRITVRTWELWQASTCLRRISLHSCALSASRLLSRSFSAWRARNRLCGSVASLIVKKSEKDAAVIGIRAVMMWRLVTERRRGKRVLRGVANGFAKRSLIHRSLSAMRWRTRLAKYAGLMASNSGRLRAGKTDPLHTAVRSRMLSKCRGWLQRWSELVHVQRMQKKSIIASSRQQSRTTSRLLAHILAVWHDKTATARGQKQGDCMHAIMSARFQSLQTHAAAIQGMWLFKSNWQLRQRQKKAARFSRDRVYRKWAQDTFNAWRYARFSQMRGAYEKTVLQALLKQDVKAKRLVFDAIKMTTSRARALHNRGLKVWMWRWRKIFVGWKEVGRKRAHLQRIAATSLCFIVKANCLAMGLKNFANAVLIAKSRARDADAKYNNRIRRLLTLWAEGAAHSRAHNAKVGRAIGVWKGKVLKVLSQAFAKLYRHQNVSFQQRMKKKVFMVCQLYYGRLRAGFDVWVDVWGYRRQHRIAAIRKVQRMASDHAATASFEAFVFCRTHRNHVREAMRRATSLTASKRVLLSHVLLSMRNCARRAIHNRKLLFNHSRRSNSRLAILALVSWRDMMHGAQTTQHRERLLESCAVLSVRRRRHRLLARHFGTMSACALVGKRGRSAVEKARFRRACCFLRDWNRVTALTCLNRLRIASEAIACYLSNFKQLVFSEVYDVVQARLRKRRLARKVRHRHLRVWMDRWVRVRRLGYRNKQSERRVGRAQERRRLEDTALVFECLLEQVWRRTERKQRQKMFLVVHRYCLQLRKYFATWWEWTVRSEWVRAQVLTSALVLHALGAPAISQLEAFQEQNACVRGIQTPRPRQRAGEAKSCLAAPRWHLQGREEEVRASAGRYFRRRATKFLMLRILLAWISALGSPDQARLSEVEWRVDAVEDEDEEEEEGEEGGERIEREGDGRAGEDEDERGLV